MPLKTLFGGLIAALLTFGCASVRVETTLLPTRDPALHSPAGPFYVQTIRYHPYGIDAAITEQPILRNYAKRMERLLRKECLDRYPRLFTDAPEQATPLRVEVDVESEVKQGKFLAWMLCTLTISSTVVPAPWDEEQHLRIKLGIDNGNDGFATMPSRSSFERNEYTWVTMLTPLGLLHRPGPSDLPKQSDAFYFGPTPCDTVPQVAAQLATAIANQIMAQPAEYWTSRRGWSPSSGNSPSPATPATPHTNSSSLF